MNPLARRSLLPLPLALGALVACSSAPVATSDQASIASTSQELYGLGSSAKMWPGGVVPVCFADVNANPDAQWYIQSILSGGWAAVANIRFAGFGNCAPSGSNQVTVSFNAASTASSIDSVGYGPRSISLGMQNVSVPSGTFTEAVLHEFGHALGFGDELDRPDNDPGGPLSPTDVLHPSLSGAALLTAHVDLSSIMAYLPPDPYVTAISAGDVLGAIVAYGSSPYSPMSSWGITCTPGVPAAGNAASTDFVVPPAYLPSAGNGEWALQLSSGGQWSNVSASVPNDFSLGYQTNGVVSYGPPIGSVETIRLCDGLYDYDCSPSLNVTIPNCNTPTDQMALSPGDNPLEVPAGGSGSAFLLLTGPWVADQGASLQLSPEEPGVPFGWVTFDPATVIDGTTVVDIHVSAGVGTTPGLYLIPISLFDTSSFLGVNTTITVDVLACTPNPAANVCVAAANGAQACGEYAAGCGDSVNCGACPGGAACTNGYCPCVPTVTSCSGAQTCGSIVNNCGQTIECGGTCGSGTTCSDNICCPSGEVNSNGVCCPSGETGGSGICCPSGQSPSGAHCCPTGELWSTSLSKCASPPSGGGGCKCTKTECNCQ